MTNGSRHLAILLAAVLTMACLTGAVLFATGPATAGAQPTLQAAPSTIIAIPLQLAAGREGLALIDRQNRTICLYQYQLHRPAHERFVLVAARSFQYDTLLEDYNNADPHPEKVKQWVLKNSPSATSDPAAPAAARQGASTTHEKTGHTATDNTTGQQK